jgi:pSer/pThr/pTyr-binding forkhead associated (FHA) protein
VARLIFRTGPYAGKGVSIPEGKTLTVGRNRDLELPLPDARLSRRHCQIENTITGFVLRDLASTNGTFINGKRLETEVALNHLDVILIGDTEIEFQMPEAIDQGKTRIGPASKARTPVVPVAMQVSPALEPATSGSTAENFILPAAKIPIEGLPAAAHAPVAAPPPPPAVAVMKDPLAIAIAELDLPLPPEPTIDLPPRPQVAFCDQCNGSIPIVDVDLCIAKEIDGKLYCRECVAKGVPGGAGGAFPPPGNWGKSASERDIDDIMKGLEQVEEIPLDGGGRRGSSARPAGHTSKQAPVAGPPKTESAFERLLNEEPEERMKPKPKVPPGPKMDELLGDEFEEIG